MLTPIVSYGDLIKPYNDTVLIYPSCQEKNIVKNDFLFIKPKILGFG
jgi:hypothetical protein